MPPLDYILYPLRTDDLNGDWDTDAPVTADAPPFATGQRVGIARHPEHGILRVTSVDRHPHGWRIGASADGYQTWASAETFVAWPDGVDEPPAPPAGHPPDGASPEAFDRARKENLADPEQQRAVSQWAAAKARWLSTVAT